MTGKAQHSEIRSQILSADTVNGERFSKSTTPLIWLETAQSTHFDAAYSPGRGCSSEASLYSGKSAVDRYAEVFAEGMMDRGPRSRAGMVLSTTDRFGILDIVEELTSGAESDDARIRILAFEIQQLRARLNR